MSIKVYISGISGNHEIRKQQQRVLFILSSLKIDFEVIDITEMGKENEREFMRTQCKLNNKPNALPPQIFNEETYCGDYEDFEIANEDEQLMSFLKLGNHKPLQKGNGIFEDTETNQMLSNVETGESEPLKA
ncbi:SH3 domain-binding glutamic acid-rich protein homolog [Nephila pilipes]|uniref:SH3 domain-binding glutamic acid-rich protein homolog n=1 Tax=Nephila pilipes TaxID=299642 RepID=A0A8X6UNG6_NEPPI|nr:SH3 domain-binding glutamic acid-rich protein homolog [Nephila pilipes]